MKVCPKCSQTYSDETLNFCLEDGSTLTTAASGTGAPPPPTVMVPAARPSATQANYKTSAGSDEMQTAVRQAPPPVKRSKAWIWAVGAIVGVCVICGGGFIGLIALAQLGAEPENDKPPVINERKDELPEIADGERKLKSTEKFSDWAVKRSKFIFSEHRDGDFVLTSSDGYYYVILVKGFTTYDATTLLTLRNTSGKASGLGYGLVFHSLPDAVFEKGYAFLIRSDNGKYRIVQHIKGKELNIVNWTRSDAIERGTVENSLEVRADGRNLEFFINGVSVKKLRDKVNYQSGIAGIYTSGEIPIAFSKMELRK